MKSFSSYLPFLTILLLGLVILPWDLPWLYVGSLLGIALLTGLIWIFRKKDYAKSFLWMTALLCLVVGLALHKVPSSLTTKLLLSGREFLNLSAIALVGLGLTYVFTDKKPLLGVSLGLLGSWAFMLRGLALPITFPEPSGPYTVGRTQQYFQDLDREEDFTKAKGDHRYMVLEIFYPAEDGAQKTGGDFKNLKCVRTHHQYEVPLSTDGPFPVILYSAGSGGSRIDNLTQAELLASHGYIFIGIDHAYLTDLTHHEKGFIKAYSMDTLDRGPSQEAYLQDILQGVRVADLKAVRSLLESWATNHYPFPSEAYDLSRVGVCGWSIGGAGAAEVCMTDPRFSAGINYDGWGFADISADTVAFQAPFLNLRSDVRPATRLSVMGTGKSLAEVRVMDQRQNEREKLLKARSKFPVFSARIPGAFHSNLRDHGLLGLSRLGPVDPRFCNQLVSEATLNFFNYHLKKPLPSQWHQWYDHQTGLEQLFP
ncbi:MAG: hypothetical protein AAFR61_09330 [Bacteroidota bacterium]